MRIKILSSWLSYDSNYQWVICWSHYALQNSWKCVLLKWKLSSKLKDIKSYKKFVTQQWLAERQEEAFVLLQGMSVLLVYGIVC